MNRSKQAGMAIKTIVALLVGLALAHSPSRRGAAATQIPRIGYVSGTGDATTHGPYVEALRQGLRQFGYVEGKNYLIESRGAVGKSKECLPLWLTSSLSSTSSVDHRSFPPAIRAAKRHTKTIPIVMVASMIQWQPA